MIITSSRLQMSFHFEPFYTISVKDPILFCTWIQLIINFLFLFEIHYKDRYSRAIRFERTSLYMEQIDTDSEEGTEFLVILLSFVTSRIRRFRFVSRRFKTISVFRIWIHERLYRFRLYRTRYSKTVAQITQTFFFIYSVIVLS